MNQKLSLLNQDRVQSKPLIQIFLCILVATMIACKSNFPDEEFSKPADMKKDTAFILGPGDSISIVVYEHLDLSGTFIVDDTGRISLPLILDIGVEGLTLRELEKKVAKELAKNFIANPKVSVGLLLARRFCILGEIRNPGCFNGIHGMNAAQAIAIAGGYTYRAYKEKFALTREDGRKVFADTSTPIFAGDTLEIFERYF